MSLALCGNIKKKKEYFEQTKTGSIHGWRDCRHHHHHGVGHESAPERRFCRAQVGPAYIFGLCAQLHECRNILEQSPKKGLMESRQGLAASGSQFSPDIWPDDGTRMAVSYVTVRRCGLLFLSIRMVAGYSELIGAEQFLVAEVGFEPTTFGL